MARSRSSRFPSRVHSIKGVMNNGVMNNLQLHDGSYKTPCERGGEAAERATFHKILTEISCSKKAQYPEKIIFFIYGNGREINVIHHNPTQVSFSISHPTREMRMNRPMNKLIDHHDINIFLTFTLKGFYHYIAL